MKEQISFGPEKGLAGERKRLTAKLSYFGFIGEVIAPSFFDVALRDYETCARILSVSVDGRRSEPIGEKREFNAAYYISWEPCPKNAEIVMEVEFLRDGTFVASVFGEATERMHELDAMGGGAKCEECE